MTGVELKQNINTITPHTGVYLTYLGRTIQESGHEKHQALTELFNETVRDFNKLSNKRGWGHTVLAIPNINDTHENKLVASRKNKIPSLNSGLPTPPSLYFNNIEEIMQATHLDSMSMNDLNANLRPGGDVSSGFIGPVKFEPMHFKHILCHDWNLVINGLGTTHVELAGHLKAVMDIAQQTPQISPAEFEAFKKEHGTIFGSPYGYQEEQTIITKFTYDPSKLSQSQGIPNTLHLFPMPDKEENPQQSETNQKGVELFVVEVQTKGFMKDPFGNTPWSGHFLIYNTDTRELCYVAGDQKSGSVSQIENYGFYQGCCDDNGKPNGFRVDPAKLVRCLTFYHPGHL